MIWWHDFNYVQKYVKIPNLMNHEKEMLGKTYIYQNSKYEGD